MATIPDRDRRADVDVYRPFFVAGVVTVLTCGCLLGAIALFGIALAGSYTIQSMVPYVLAHANSQLFGWVGFFVMGFALQQHAPSVERVALFHRLAWFSLVSMAAGIILRFIAEPLFPLDRTAGTYLGVLSGGLQIIAVGSFLFNTAYTRHRNGRKMTWPTLFVMTSLAWLLAVAIAEPFAFLGSHQVDSAASIQFVADWFGRLREAQFLGFVSMMIFGVSLVKLTSCFGAKDSHRAAGLGGYVLWITGLIARMANVDSRFVSFCFVLGAVSIVFATRIFEPLAMNLRAHKFIRAAFAWLIIAGLLMVAQPLHLAATGQEFSHAFVGAIRHAVTVGFISQMIVGFGSHIAAGMNGFDPEGRNPLWATFWLLNIGNFLRVATEIGTDYTPTAFRLMGVTGFVELLGLSLWGFEMLRLMFAPRANEGVRVAA